MSQKIQGLVFTVTKVTATQDGGFEVTLGISGTRKDEKIITQIITNRDKIFVAAEIEIMSGNEYGIYELQQKGKI